MGTRGVYFALESQHVERLRTGDDDERLSYLQEEIEDDFFENDQAHVAEVDSAWEAIHRCLTDGALAHDNGAFPLSHVVLGGELLYKGDDYIMSLKTPAQVREIAAALAQVTEATLRAGYQKIDPEDYDGPLSDEDFAYTWEWLSGMREFWNTAAREQRYVLFAVDQ